MLKVLLIWVWGSECLLIRLIHTPLVLQEYSFKSHVSIPMLQELLIIRFDGEVQFRNVFICSLLSRQLVHPHRFILIIKNLMKWDQIPP